MAQTHKLKIEVQPNRIEKGNAAEEVREWSLDIESKVSGFEEVVDEIKETITREHAKVKIEEEKIEKEKRGLHFEEELKFEETKLEMKQEYEKKMEEARMKSGTKGNNAKLP